MKFKREAHGEVIEILYLCGKFGETFGANKL